MKCLTWNLEWKPPGSSAGRLIEQEVAQLDPDVICFTETVVSMIPQGHRIEADADYGYEHDGSRRKVALWSKSHWEDIDTLGDDEMPKGRFASGVSLGIRFVGVCIPWRDAHVRTGEKDKKPWQDHLAYCAGLRRVLERYSRDHIPICLFGDFNQRIPRVTQPNEVFEALIRAIPSSFRILTAGAQDADGKSVIDHFVVSDCLTAEALTIVPRIATDGTQLSDHVGIAVTITK
jgi:exonuclease III